MPFTVILIQGIYLMEIIEKSRKSLMEKDVQYITI